MSSEYELASHLQDIYEMEKETLQKLFFDMLKVHADQDEAFAERSLTIICSLYEKQVWVDHKTAKAIVTACLQHTSIKIKRAASSFLFGFEIKDPSSPLALLIKKKRFREGFVSHLKSSHQSELLMLCKLYVWAFGPDSILGLFTLHRKELSKKKNKDAIELLLTSFRAGLGKVIDGKRIQLLMGIQRLVKGELMELVRKHVIECIQIQQDEKVLKRLKKILIRMLKGNQGDAEGSLAVLRFLYKNNFWFDTKITRAICDASLNSSSKITRAASLFILDLDDQYSSAILDHMSEEKLLTCLERCKEPEVKIIFFKIYALKVENPVISEDAILESYVKMSSNQKEVAEFFARGLKDFHVKNPLEAPTLFGRAAQWFFKDNSTTHKSKAAGLLFMKEVCKLEPQLISEDLKLMIFDISKSYRDSRSSSSFIEKNLKSAQELIDLIQKLDDQKPQSSKRKNEANDEEPAKKSKGNE